MEARDCTLPVDLIQALVIVTCGFLVGSYIKSFNIDHYNALLSMIPKFAACPISIIRKNVQLVAGEKNGPRVPAAHVQCDAFKRKTIVQIPKAQYNWDRPSDIANLPYGRVFKFCELSVLTGMTRC